MDFGTTITDGNITRIGDELPTPEAKRKSNIDATSYSANTVGSEIRPTENGSSTNSLPNSIWTSWGKIAQADMSVRMFSDLVRLANAPDGWRGAGSVALRPGSIKNFLEFWSIVRGEAVEPELALAPDGSLYAEWFESQRKRLDVRFAEQNVFFGLFAKNNILEGVDHLTTVAQILRLHQAKPLTWSAR
ncbi:MAG: hypothetical protein WAM62_02510 [Pseudolabrys sp.]